jgi:hypothetical protein
MHEVLGEGWGMELCSIHLFFDADRDFVMYDECWEGIGSI